MTENETTPDLQRLEAKLDALSGQVAALVAAQQGARDLYEEMAPIAKLAMGVGAKRLAQFEQRGYFDFAREAFNVVDAIVAGYTPEDVHALADQAVRILGIVRRLTQPGVLDLAEHAAEAVEHAGDEQPPGVLGILKATSRDEDVRRGLMVALAVLRQVGQAAHGTPSTTTTLVRLNPLLGGKRNLAKAGAAEPTPAAAPPTQQTETPVCHDLPPGVTWSSDGFLVDANDWTPELAAAVAERFGLAQLTDRHHKVIDFARAEFLETGASPNIRRLTSGSGVPTRELYALFPQAPAKMAARIAGIPKPVGCI